MKPEGLSAYIAVTAAYWAFMLTDGALRMLVLLHFHTLGFSAIELAYLFLFYEFAGMITNLSAGWVAARFGLSRTLYAGLSLQIVALILLAQLSPDWGIAASVIFVMAVQGLSGVAKDLAKMSSKSAVKLLAPKGQGGAEDGLFRWVAVLTGSKNAVKGVGFLLGAALLGLFGFITSIVAMAVTLTAVLIAVVLFMPAGLPEGKKSAKVSEVFSKDPDINRLSLARMFLFGARDVWFVVGIPIYFYGVLSDGSEDGNRAAFFLIGSFMALWIIAYGAVQGAAPRIVGAKDKALSAIKQDAVRWCFWLAMVPLTLAVAAMALDVGLTAVLVIGLLVFGFVFAVNSSLHSYLILAFSTSERVTMDVGFYYMSNAAGRLIGTLLSGLSFQFGGLVLCLVTSGAMALCSWIAMRGLTR
ncbi:organoarsenical effux MFS transporter ArsJ [Cochlodiniinecator piscidefendens]|uniref:organoarsenical effux MFS transporter ArsJ n=1 Tax=Cochlodiniinecator piscidefendens TaxID=2715756 RepID=UPI00140C4894|nr:organoarsenical effux MFS transporter ArsJ [Cochlodiniinecator piscidefendens]